MIYTMIFLYIISSLFVLDLGIVVLKQIRLESEDHKASLGVNVHNQEEMIALGIHPKYKVPRDPSVWTKTPHEKELVKECRHRYGRGIKKY